MVIGRAGRETWKKSLFLSRSACGVVSVVALSQDGNVSVPFVTSRLAHFPKFESKKICFVLMKSTKKHKNVQYVRRRRRHYWRQCKSQKTARFFYIYLYFLFTPLAVALT